MHSDATNLVEGSEAASVVTTILLAIKQGASQIVGTTSWDACLDVDLFTNVQCFRTYDVSSVSDCARLIQNKHHHYEELPTTGVKARIDSNAEGYLVLRPVVVAVPRCLIRHSAAGNCPSIFPDRAS